MAHHITFWDGKRESLCAAYWDAARLSTLWRRLVRDNVVPSQEPALGQLLAAPPLAEAGLRWAPLPRHSLCGLLLTAQRRNARLLAR